jgi:hypothetical protein
VAFETVPPEGLDAADTSQIIAMAWDDSTSFEAIALNYGLDEVWRMRVRGNSRKHAVKQALQSARIQAAPAPALADTSDEFPLRESPAFKLAGLV